MAFAPVFQQPFSATFNRAAAAAAAPAWYVVAGKTCVAAYQPKGAASLAASYVNLANPGTYDAAPGVAPTWASATGWQSDATNWLDTGVSWTTTWTIICRFSGVANTAAYLFGCDNSSATQRLGWTTTLGSSRSYYNGGVRTVSGGSVTSGVVAIANLQGYLNGSADGAAIAAGSTPTPTVALFGIHRGAGIVAGIAAYIQAVAVYSATLTAGEVATVSAAMAAL